MAIANSDLRFEDKMDLDPPLLPIADGSLKEVPRLTDNATMESSRLTRVIASSEPPSSPPNAKPKNTHEAGEINELKAELTASLIENKNIKGKLEELRRQLDDAMLEMVTLKKPENQTRKLKEDLAKTRQNLRNLDYDHQQLRAKLKKEQQTAQEGIDYLKRQNQELAEKSKAFQTEVKRAQEKAIREMSDARWAPMPDDFHRENLRTLYQDIRDWAKKWTGSSLPLESVPHETRLDFVKNHLSRVCQLTSNNQLPAELSSPKSKMKSKAPWLLLSALLTYEVQTQVFAKTFFCFEEASGPALEKTHSKLLEANPREAHIWRSMMWRIINPPKSNYFRSQKDEDVAKKTFALTRNLCNNIAADFEKGYAEMFMPPSESKDDIEDKSRELREILVKAVKIATDLWTRRSSLHQRGLQELRALKEGFTVDSPIMEAHPLSKVDYDDPSHNGRRIGVVVRPALLADCEDEGEGGDSDRKAFRVLAKAVVWLEDGIV